MSGIGRRLLLLVPTVLGVLTLVFFLVHLIPGDPVEVMLGETASSADLVQLRADLGLDRPLGEQYARFLGGLAHADLGHSFFYRKPVLAVIGAALPATALLAVAALAVALLIALPVGILAAVRRNRLTDRLALVGSLVGVSMPNFWLGPMLIILFSFRLGWLPVSGREGAASLVLPALTLGTALSAILVRMTRASMLDVLGEDYLRTARAKGVGERAVIARHALRNALLPVVTIVGLQFGALLSGAVITENVFAWPGVGTLLIQAISARDYPLVQGCVLVISLCYVAVNFLTDALYAVIDPGCAPDRRETGRLPLTGGDRRADPRRDARPCAAGAHPLRIPAAADRSRRRAARAFGRAPFRTGPPRPRHLRAGGLRGAGFAADRDLGGNAHGAGRCRRRRGRRLSRRRGRRRRHATRGHLPRVPRNPARNCARRRARAEPRETW